MPTAPLLLYDDILHDLLVGELPPLANTPICALLLGAGHAINLSHRTFSDIEADEISGYDYKRVGLTGQQVTVGQARPCFHSDAILFGNPVTIGPVRYMALVFGRPANVAANSRLLGIADLSGSPGAVEAQRSEFRVTPPEEGWFTVTRNQ